MLGKLSWAAACVGMLLLGALAAAGAAPRGSEAGGGRAVPAQAPGRAAEKLIRGIVFLASPERVRPGGWAPAFAGVDVLEVPFLDDDEFLALARSYIGKPNSPAVLNELAQATVKFAGGQGYSVVGVMAPQQQMENGDVQMLVAVARVGKIRTEGNEWFHDAELTEDLHVKSGDYLRVATLDADLAYLNTNPFLSVDGILTPGADPGTTDIVLRAKDRIPLRVFASYANDGAAATGRDQVGAGFSWGDVLHTGQRLDYQYTRSLYSARFESHQGSYAIPLPWQDVLSLSGSYALSHSPVTGPFESQGFAEQVSVRYTHTLPRLALLGGLTEEVVFGADYKKNNNNLLFGGQQVFQTAPTEIQGVVSYNAGLTDKYGSTTLAWDNFVSPGQLAGGDDAASFQAVRPGSDPSYAYTRLHVERLTNLPAEFSLVLKGTAQYASRNLLFSEKLAVGGANSVRGFDEGHFTGDNGVLASVELRTPSVSLLRGAGDLNDQLQFLVFYDYGVAESASIVVPGTDGTEVAASVGPGLRYAINPYLTARLDYGYPLRGENTPGGLKSGRTHVSLIVGY